MPRIIQQFYKKTQREQLSSLFLHLKYKNKIKDTFFITKKDLKFNNF